MDLIVCKICGEKRKQITSTHVKMHGLSGIQEYKEKYPDAATISDGTLNKRNSSRRLQVEQPLLVNKTPHNLHIAKHRTKKRISYDEFLELLKQGESLISIKKQGVSKHQIGFYSSLCQNKISITKEQFEAEYISGASLDEIAEKYNVSRDHMTQLREFYGIKRLGAKFINRKKTEKPLTCRQLKIIYGSLMGDCGKMSSSSIKMKQSTKQKEYLMWKYEELKEHVSLHSLQEHSTYDERYNKVYHTIIFYTNANTQIEEIVTQFYSSGRKCVSKGILDNLDELSLAVWHMDDGTVDWNFRSKEYGWNSQPSISLCTDSFTVEECELIVEWFKTKYKLEPVIRFSAKKHPHIKFNTKHTEKFLNIVRPYIIPSMQYKCDYDAYLIWRANREAMKLKNQVPNKLLSINH